MFSMGLSQKWKLSEWFYITFATCSMALNQLILAFVSTKGKIIFSRMISPKKK